MVCWACGRVDDCRSKVPELFINLCHKVVNYWRLRFTSDYDAGAAIRQQILSPGTNPRIERGRNPSILSDCFGNCPDVACCDGDAMISICTGDGWRRLRDVKPAHQLVF